MAAQEQATVIQTPDGYLPLSAYRLGIEKDPTRRHRIVIAVGATVLAGLAYYLAWHHMAERESGGLLGIGFGRLAAFAEKWGWNWAWTISALEYAHYAIMMTVFALVIWFGQTGRERKLPDEEMIFHRRQSRWISSNAAIAGIVALIFARVLIAWKWEFFAGIVEVVSLSFLGGALWQALVPEARLSVSVILCSNMGWGNRISGSGGFLRFASRLTISKDFFISANARDIGGFEMLGGMRTLELKFVDECDQQHRLRIRGIARDPEIGVLASTLNTRFIRAMTRHILKEATRLGRTFSVLH